jgi:hypothetical protein
MTGRTTSIMPFREMFFVSALQYLLLYDIIAADSRSYSPVTKLAIQGWIIRWYLEKLSASFEVCN